MKNDPAPFYRWRPHPWHGLELGVDPPVRLNAYIELTPFDLVKYEIDKATGYLKVDRPQQTSSLPPSMYGFIPRTYCGNRVGALMDGATKGDRDPLDICVISERPIARAEIILHARVVGGIPMLDGGEADDKIVAVLNNDHFYDGVDDISELPVTMINRLRHYFSHYKQIPGEEMDVSIGDTYGRDQAVKVIEAAVADYDEQFGNFDE